MDEGETPPGGHAWSNGFGRVGWGGPMPPPEHGKHRYFFCLYAVSEALPLHSRAGSDAVHSALKGQGAGQ